MDPHPRARAVVSLIVSAGRRTPAESERLLAALHQWCWPGGATDHTDLPGRTWLKRWGPQPVRALEVHCTCAEGRCDLCN